MNKSFVAYTTIIVFVVTILTVGYFIPPRPFSKRCILFEGGKYILVEGIKQGCVAEIEYDDGYQSTGWQTVKVKTSQDFPDTTTSYWAGYLEGNSVAKIINNSWRNTQKGFCARHGKQLCTNLNDYLQKNVEWMSNKIKYHGATSPYWFHVNLILSQLEGLHHGYLKAVEDDPNNLKNITMQDILLMNLNGDLLDLVRALAPVEERKTLDENVEEGNLFSDGRCSALIKVLDNNTDLLVSHVTWNVYNAMLRHLKKYDFPFQTFLDSGEIIPGRVATFSSYPAYLGSGDDFIQLSSGLLALETTLGNSNPDLWQYVNPIGQVQEWIRVIVASRLAKDAKQWAEIFQTYNSGTYNNQWMIVDYNKFDPGTPIRPNTLWVVEQLPGTIILGDQSDILRNESYWASYNIPFYEKIYNISGLPAFAKKYGDFYTYDMSPRARIFRRDHSNVTDYDSFVKLMRYNDFKNDPLSSCNCTPPYSADKAISARDDLNPKNGSYPFGALGHRAHGGIDMKATNYLMFKSLNFGAISGPTYDQQPVFKWSEQDFVNSTPHHQQPDVWDFEIVYTHFTLI